MNFIFRRLKLQCMHFVLFIIIIVPSISYAQTVSIWGEYHPPLNGKPDSEKPGFMIEIAQAIFKKHGYNINYKLGSRARGVMMVEEGKVDCIVNAKIKEHQSLAFPQEPWGYHAATIFAVPQSKLEFNDIEQVENINLGVIAGMRYDNGALDKYIEGKNDNVSFSYGNNAMESQVKKLLSGRTEAMVSCPLLMRGQLESMGLPMEAAKVIGEVKPFVGMYFACGKGQSKTENFIKMIDKEIPALRESGELQKILDKYGQIDWLSIHQSLSSAQ